MLNWSYMYASYLNVYILSYCKLFFMLFICDYIIFLITLNMLLKTLKLEYFLKKQRAYIKGEHFSNFGFVIIKNRKIVKPRFS